MSGIPIGRDLPTYKLAVFYIKLMVLDMEAVYIGTRIEQYIKDLVEKVSHERGMNVSDFIRFLIKRELATLSFLGPDTKKAFGIKEAVKVE